MNTAAEDLAARLARGEDFGTIAMAMLDPGTRETVKHCAAVVTFDAAMYERVLRPAGGPSLDELQDARRVQPVAGKPDWYRLEPYLRDGAWSAWWTDEQLSPGSTIVPSSLARYAGRLADDYRAAGQPLEELRAALLADAGRARDLFLELYEQADEAFNLARAQDAIDVMASADRAQVLPVELARLRNEHQVFLSARSLRAAEFHQSARYLSREEPERALTGLLDGQDGHALPIVAPGGAGKTMQLRWFVARHCLRQRPMVPCALIDFDVADPLGAARYPWLLLLELARQLDVQIPGAPFRELVRDYERYLPLLSQAPGPDVVTVDEGTTGDAEDITYRFCAALAESRPADAPVVLLLDTMEEIVLRPAGGTSGFVELLDRVRREVPSARLILSGRYDLADRLDGARQRFGPLRPLRIAEFSPDEAQRYLTAIRGITQPDLVRAIVRKCDGLPFTLALFGDIAAQDPGLSAAEVERSQGPALLYCIVRILERIDDDRLRWVLRYGVLPRQLTLDFLEKVISPYLVRGIDGTGGDDPAADARPARSMQIFQQAQYPPPADAGDLRRLWDQLRRYASQSSWVSPAGDRALTFHVRLRAPLRELLRAQPVFESLHRDAVAYFERRAGDEPGQWARWTREALYHRFQSGEPTAEQAWRDAIAQAWAAGRPDWAEDLAADLLSAGYLDETDGETERGTISGQLRYEAHLQVTQVNTEAARTARQGPDGPRWKTAEEHLERALQLVRSGTAAGSIARLEILRASAELARGDQVAAQACMTSLRHGQLSPEEHRDLLVLEAENAALTGDEATDGRFGEAFQASVELGDISSAAQIATDSAAAHLRADDPLAALRWCERADDLDLAPPDEQRLAGIASTALLELCLPQGAIRRVLGDAAAHFVPGDAGDATAEALLALDRPVHALRVLLPGGEKQAGNESASWRRALLGGRAHGLLLQLASATRMLEQGLRLRPGNREGAILANEQALIHLRCGGDLRQADYYLGAAAQYEAPPGSRDWLDLQLTRMALERAQDRPGQARETLSRIFEGFRARRPTRRGVAAAAVHGLPVAAEGERDELMRVLLDAINDAQFPASTRVGMLRDLRYCPAIEGVEASTLTTLEREILQPWREGREQPDDTDEDDAWVDLAAVEVLRLLGRPAEAKTTLDRAVTVLADADPLIWLEWVRAADRIGEIQTGESEPPPDLLERYRAFPAVSAAYLIDLTARRLPADPDELSRQRLLQAERLLGQAEKTMPAWQSRLDEARARLDRRVSAAESGQLPSSGWPPLTILRPPVPRPGERTAELTANDVPWRGLLPDPELIEELRADWTGWAARNGQILARAIGPVLAEAGPPGQTDIRLICDGPATPALPWELAAVDGVPVATHPAVRVVYRGGYRGSETAEARLLELSLRRLGLLDPRAPNRDQGVKDALRDFQGSIGLAPADWPNRATWQDIRRALRDADAHPQPVLLLQQDAEGSIRYQRGSQASSADALAVYRTLGARVSVVNPRPSIARDWVKSVPDPGDRPGVLHICAGLEISARTPVLSFGEPGPSGALSAVDVSELVASVAADQPPLVVLDVLTPATGTEQIRQLLLRNIFCDQLIRLGQANTVLGTGLASDEIRPIQLHNLILSLGSVANAALPRRQLDRPVIYPSASAEMAIPETSTALFSRLPPDAVIDPGAW
ncbi:MAG TPA: hypothetical protein VFQ68_22410 [Streptosporangiaceae bacterium]|nr:hypothetical protein [Streptosporangiaceae bacterium]